MAQTLPKAVRKQMAKTGRQNTQHILNTVLWQIVMRNGGAIIVPGAKLRQMPPNVALKVQHVAENDTVRISAHLPSVPGQIFVPNNGIIQ